MIKQLFNILAAILLSTVGAVLAAESVPAFVNYQGTLTDDAGKPMVGPIKLEFNLYDAPVGGEKVWGPQIFENVSMINGQFNVILSVTTDDNKRPITEAFRGANRFLGIKVGDAKEISPRQQILSTPYAIQAYNGSPVGAVQMYMGTTEPDGWLFCDGRSLIDDSLKDAKFNALKSHLTGLGQDKLPNFRNKFPFGSSSREDINKQGGKKEHKITIEQMPTHNHKARSDYIYLVTRGGSCFVKECESTGRHGERTMDLKSTEEIRDEGKNQEFEIMPPYLTINYIIKY
ncbi:exported hypothetical protein [Gammaproteobacteria bacterium]